MSIFSQDWFGDAYDRAIEKLGLSSGGDAVDKIGSAIAKSIRKDSAPGVPSVAEVQNQVVNPSQSGLSINERQLLIYGGAAIAFVAAIFYFGGRK